MSRAELIQRYFDGELAPDAHRHVERTMSRNERQELADLAILRALLRGCFADTNTSMAHRTDGMEPKARR
ncbi:MAG: hypothetical protein JWM53_1482 [bacterium]|nr:hypothetical protein [bacterium]